MNNFDASIRTQGEIVALPDFNDHGDLPLGIHQATLNEVVERFGTTPAKRQVLALRLERIYKLAVGTSHVARFIVFGSFVTDKIEPNDVDVFIMMENSFDFGQLVGETRLLFDHGTAQTHFGCSLFWIRRLAALDGEQATIEHWQIKRNREFRGIIEIVGEE
jgi:predicted nucleotidyltransferase